MELLEAIRIIRNQKKLVIPLLIVAFIAAGIMITRMDTTYETRGTITLLNSNLQSNANPYLSFDQSLQTTAQVLGGSITTADAKAKYAKKGLSTSYEVAVPYDPTRTTLLPMLEVKVNATTPQVASTTRDALLNDIKDELSRKQTEAGAPRDTWIQAFAVAENEVIPVSGSKVRTLVIVFGLGAGFALAAAFVVDGFKRGVKNTRRGETIVLENAKPEPIKTETRKATTPRARTSGIKPKTEPKPKSKKGTTTSSIASTSASTESIVNN